MTRTLENEQLKVTIEDKGAELVSVYDKERSAERMWNADPSIWNRHAPILFPFVGKVADSVYRYQGKEYQMKTQHGFARDLDFICTDSNEYAITHCLKSNPATKEIYPFDFELYVTHRFDEKNHRVLKVEWRIQNTSPENMYYSIGGHPGFQTPLYPQEKREDYYLEIPGKKELEYLLINTATGLVITDKKYSLTLEDGFYPIKKTMFDKDALIFEHTQIETMRIADPNKKPYITLECKGFPYVGIWSKPNGEFVCLEPWLGRTDDDGFCGTLEEKTGVQVLKGMESKQIGYQIEFH